MKFCCDRFKMHYEFPRNHGLNIRIVKYTPEELIDTKNLYRFYIAIGYNESQKQVAHLNIAYCPFCGTSLFRFYKNDEYINESPGYF